MGAWIETGSVQEDLSGPLVAPRVGAWIETSQERIRAAKSGSPPAWGRGLKQIEPDQVIQPQQVAPRVGAWIETIMQREAVSITPSRPPRGGVD